MSIHWVASYPKSGNTWLRFLLHTYFNGPVKHTREVLDFSPDLHIYSRMERPLPIDRPGRLFCKTHFRFCAILPHNERTTGIIYLIRHPLDVMLSNIDYLPLIFGASCPSPNELICDFCKGLGVSYWREKVLGSWPENVLSWLSACREFPHVIVRFEDMKENPARELRRVLEAFDQQPDEGRIQQAVKFSHREVMRELEMKERQAGDTDSVFGSPHSQKMFLKQKRTRRKDLPPNILDLFWQAFGHIPEYFGYGREGVLESAPAFKGLNVATPAVLRESA